MSNVYIMLKNRIDMVIYKGRYLKYQISTKILLGAILQIIFKQSKSTQSI